jgi:plastocyanin
MRVFATAALIVGYCALAGGASAAPRPTPLTLTIAGKGSVAVHGTGSLACEDACDATFRPSGGVIVMSAHPAAGSHFTKWTGACRGTRLTCFLHPGFNAHVDAFFSPTAVATPAAPASSVTVVEGKPTEFAITLSTRTVRQGKVTFHVSNLGAIPHDFFVCSAPGDGTANSCTGSGTPLGGGTLTVTFTAPGTYEYLCTVPGHAAAGSKGLLTVK